MPVPQFDRLIEPDLFHWEQCLQQLKQLGIEDQDFQLQLQKLALGSTYAITQLHKYPQLLETLRHCTNFDLSAQSLTDSLADVIEPAQIKKILRLFRHQKLVEIIYLDICRNEKVENTLLYLSQLADLLIEQAQLKSEQILSAKHGHPLDDDGEPMPLNIIGMGKLGGGELNFSSDIDLICTYSEEGQLKGFGQLSHSQYFTNVVKLFRQLLNESTEDGFVYRVDLRLRPWGESGPVALSHTAFEHYYQLHGREWEQYAMVKARVITGRKADKDYLQSILRPFIYRRYHDYRVFDGLAQLKHKIDQQASRKGAKHNIKIGRGGIREIEFFVQAFQILKGGRNHLLQTQSLYRALQVLADQHITDQPTLSLMHDAYNFLRMLENRIQMLNDQQTHELPQKQNQLERLGLLLGYPDWASLEKQLQHHQSEVNQVFSTLFVQEDTDQPASQPRQNLDELSTDKHLQAIQELGFAQPEAIHQQLQSFYTSKALIYMSDKAKKRFHVFFPELLKQVCAYTQQRELLEKLLALLSSISGRSVYFELLYQNIPLLVKLVDLFNSSSWIAEEVTRHPILIESLLYPDHLSDRFNANKLTRELDVQLNNVAGDIEMELDVLRQFKREHTIVIATAQIAEEISIEQVSRYLSDLAEIILQAVHRLSLQELAVQYGQPQCRVDGEARMPVLGIIAYGKLGGFELHYQSDLDIIFLHNSSGEQQQTSGPRVIDNATYFSRLAQKIISKVTLLTAAGKLYEIDTRLRPDGASGMLVSSLNAYRQYQLEKAWVWEHQAIIRARFIAGDESVRGDFNNIRHEVLALPRQVDELKTEIVDMREKIYQAKKPPEGEIIDIKHSRGCMVDIEFLVQYWVLQHANKFASLCESTDNIGLITELHDLGLISIEELQLRDIYQIFHKWLHARVLQNQSAELPADKLQHEINVVMACWGNTFD